jgi:hypothetical protein
MLKVDGDAGGTYDERETREGGSFRVREICATYSFAQHLTDLGIT